MNVTLIVVMEVLFLFLGIMIVVKSIKTEEFWRAVARCAIYVIVMNIVLFLVNIVLFLVK